MDGVYRYVAQFSIFCLEHFCVHNTCPDWPPRR